jgi:tyrosine-protein kinase Etk/Wzc
MMANLCSIAMKNLYTVVFSGPDGGPPRQISKEDLTQLIQYVQDPFDVIILDTPPCSLIAETVEIAEVADCGIMVIRQDHSSKNQILDGVRLLADSGLPLIGCVFNGVDGRMTPGGYQYGYSYGYGYGNGYGYGYGGEPE